MQNMTSHSLLPISKQVSSWFIWLDLFLPSLGENSVLDIHQSIRLFDQYETWSRFFSLQFFLINYFTATKARCDRRPRRSLISACELQYFKNMYIRTNMLLLMLFQSGPVFVPMKSGEEPGQPIVINENTEESSSRSVRFNGVVEVRLLSTTFCSGIFNLEMVYYSGPRVVSEWGCWRFDGSVIVFRLNQSWSCHSAVRWKAFVFGNDESCGYIFALGNGLIVWGFKKMEN